MSNDQLTLTNAQLTFVHALSPLHAGVGQGAGVIDLPIAREKATGIPFLPGSSLKGALRTRGITLDKQERKEWHKIFGADELEEENYKAGQVQFSDQRLLLLPVRSLAGIFAWVTSPFLLQRLRRDCADVSRSIPEISLPTITNWQSCLIANDSVLGYHTQNAKRNVYLEDLDLTAPAPTDQDDGPLNKLAQWLGTCLFPEENQQKDTTWQTSLRQRLCLVHDDVMNFLLTTGTEITTRIKLEDNSKTVQEGGLWYEEALPAESVLSGLVLATPVKKHGMSVQDIFKLMHDLDLTNQPLQLGGKSTVGRGLCRIHLIGGKA